MTQWLLEQAEDETAARCWKCDEGLESWTVIKAGHCPKCQATINQRDIDNGWCLDCGKPLRGDEAGMEYCFDCQYGG